MSRNPYTGVVVLRCAQAAQLVNGAARPGIRAVDVTALLQAAIFHLYNAYVLHLRTLGANYDCPAPEKISSIDGLQTDLALVDKVPAEVMEIRTLLDDPTSWLSAVLRAHERLFDAANAAAFPAVSDAGINLRQDGDKAPALNTDQLAIWIRSMDEMVDRHGALMCEF